MGPGGQPNTLRAAKHTQSRGEWWRGAGGQPRTLRAGGVVEGSGRAAKHTKSRGEWWRGAGGQPSTLRAGRSGGGGREGIQAHSEPGGVVEGGREGIQAHSEPGGVVEGARRAAKRTQSREDWWRVTSL